MSAPADGRKEGQFITLAQNHAADIPQQFAIEGAPHPFVAQGKRQFARKISQYLLERARPHGHFDSPCHVLQAAKKNQTRTHG
jgi:hypothetical protein